jgi:hypothetical protein
MDCCPAVLSSTGSVDMRTVGLRSGAACSRTTPLLLPLAVDAGAAAAAAAAAPLSLALLMLLLLPPLCRLLPCAEPVVVPNGESLLLAVLSREDPAG